MGFERSRARVAHHCTFIEFQPECVGRELYTTNFVCLLVCVCVCVCVCVTGRSL